METQLVQQKILALTSDKMINLFNIDDGIIIIIIIFFTNTMNLSVKIKYIVCIRKLIKN